MHRETVECSLFANDRWVTLFLYSDRGFTQNTNTSEPDGNQSFMAGVVKSLFGFAHCVEWRFGLSGTWSVRNGTKVLIWCLHRKAGEWNYHYQQAIDMALRRLPTYAAP